MKYSKFVPKWAKNQDLDEPEFVPHGPSYPDEELPPVVRHMSTEKILRAKSAAKKMGLCDVDFDDYDLGVNPVTGDKMGSKYSGLCMHPGCYQAVSHDKKHACGRDHGGGKGGCGKYFCDTHLIVNELCITCWNNYWQSLSEIIVDRIQKAKCEDG